MNRKTLVVTALISASLLTSCTNKCQEDVYYEEMIGYEVQLEEARNKISELQSQISDLESSVSALQSEVDRFNYEDWEYVVPDVVYKSNSLEGDLYSLSSAADELEEALE